MSILKHVIVAQQHTEPMAISKIFSSLEASPEKNNKYRSQHFIPFQNERDRMNRLVKQSPVNFQKKDQKRGQSLSENITRTQSLDLHFVTQQRNIFSNTAQKINMHFFSQKTHLFDLKKLDSRIRKKNLISIKLQNPHKQILQKSKSVPKQLLIKVQQTAFSKMNFHELQSKRRKNVVFGKTLYHQKVEHPLYQQYQTEYCKKTEYKLKPQKNNKISLEKSNGQKQRAKSIKTIDIDLDKNSKIQNNEDQKKIQSYPELDRFRQMKKLSTKVIDDFEITHNMFIQKIKAAKKDAIKLIQQNNF